MRVPPLVPWQSADPNMSHVHIFPPVPRGTSKCEGRGDAQAHDSGSQARKLVVEHGPDRDAAVFGSFLLEAPINPQP